MLKDLHNDFPAYPKEGSYLDSSTRGLQPETSIEIQYNLMKSNNYTVRKSLHRRARSAENHYYDAKKVYANFINAHPNEIAWIQNTDIASNQIIHSIIEKFEKPKIFSSVFEHHSILSPLLYLRQKGKIDLELLSTFEEVCLPEYIEKNAEENDIIILGHTTQLLGLERPIVDIGNAASLKGAISIIDFSRTAGQSMIDMGQNNIDIGFFEGSIDLLGPPNNGFMYVKEEVVDQLENPFPSSGNVGMVSKNKLDQIHSIEKFEMGGPDIVGMEGLRESIEYLTNLSRQNIKKHKIEIIKYLINRIDELESVNLIDPLFDGMPNYQNRGSMISITGDFHPHDIALFLDESYNIQIRSGLLCAHPSVTELGLEEVLQISTHVYTSKNDIDLFVESIEKITAIM